MVFGKVRVGLIFTMFAVALIALTLLLAAPAWAQTAENGDGGGATATTDNTTATTDGDGATAAGVNADDNQYKAGVIVFTIPHKVLPATGGPPLLGLAILGLALIGVGSSVLRAAIRRDR